MFVITLSDIFGLGLLGIAVIIFIIFGIFVVISKVSESVKDNKTSAKKEDGDAKPKEANKKNDDGTKLGLIILAVYILGMIIYRVYFAPKYSIIYEIKDPVYEYAKDGTPTYSDVLKCKQQVSQFNSANPPFRYKCAKNCELDVMGVYVVKCEEVYE